MTGIIRGFGWKPDRKDDRDHKFSARAGIPPEADLPEWVDNTGVALVLDQEETSACVAHATVQAIHASMVRQGHDPGIASRLAIYFWSRAVTGDQHEDDGTYLRSAIQVCHKLGYPPESSWPWDQSKVNEAPPFGAIRAAADQRIISGYSRVVGTGTERRRQIKAAVADQGCVIYGTYVDEAIFDVNSALPWTRTGEIAGGHALPILGYDQDGAFGPNSWGIHYGYQPTNASTRGFIKVSWQQMLRDETNDLWVIHTVPLFSAA